MFPSKKISPFFLSVLLFFVFFLSSCSIRKIITDQLEPVVEEMQTSILAEPEEELVTQSFPFAIKLTESLYHYYPASPFYSGKLAMLFAAYTFSEIDNSPYSDFDDEAEKKITQIINLYERAYQYGLKSMETAYPGFKQKIFQEKEVDDLLQTIKVESVEPLFWFNFAWAMKLFYNLEDLNSIIHLETIKKIADRIEILNPNYMFGINKAIFIAYYGGRAEVLGGDLEMAKKYYQQSLKISKGKSIVNEFVYLRFVTILSGNEKEFEKLYQKIIKFDLSQNPKFYFINQMIKNKAQKLYLKKNQFF